MYKKLLLYFALLLWFVVPLKAQPTIVITVIMEVIKFQVVENNVKILKYNKTEIDQCLIYNNSTVLANYLFDAVALFSFSESKIDLSQSKINFKETYRPINRLANEVNKKNKRVLSVLFLESNNSTAFLNNQILRNSTAIEVFEFERILQDFDQEYGMITVFIPLEISNTPIKSDRLNSHQNFLNPFMDFNFIDFNQRHKAFYIDTICDIRDMQISESKKIYNQDIHNIKYDNNSFPILGKYFLYT